MFSFQPLPPICIHYSPVNQAFLFVTQKRPVNERFPLGTSLPDEKDYLSSGVSVQMPASFFISRRENDDNNVIEQVFGFSFSRTPNDPEIPYLTPSVGSEIVGELHRISHVVLCWFCLFVCFFVLFCFACFKQFMYLNDCNIIVLLDMFVCLSLVPWISCSEDLNTNSPRACK